MEDSADQPQEAVRREYPPELIERARRIGEAMTLAQREEATRGAYRDNERTRIEAGNHREEFREVTPSPGPEND